MNVADLVAPLPPRRHVVITGGTGFVGRRLIAALCAAGHTVTVQTRHPGRNPGLPEPVREIATLDAIAADAHVHALVNLAGEPIAARPWTAAQRQRIIGSRVAATQACVALLNRLETAPDAFITGSAIGWYGLNAGEILDENSPGRACFSRDVCLAWEGAARGAPCRTVALRIGLVLGPDGGLLARMLPSFRLGLGGPFGKGENWMSWIHRDDLVRLIAHAIADPALAGPVNATAPNPVTGRDFAKALGRALHRPVVLRVPALPLTLLLGDFARELLLGGQRVVPARAQASGFAFAYPDLDPALRAILS